MSAPELRAKLPDRKSWKRILRGCSNAFRRFHRRSHTPLPTNSEKRDLEIWDQLARCSEALEEPYWRLRTLVNTKFAEHDVKSRSGRVACAIKPTFRYYFY